MDAVLSLASALDSVSAARTRSFLATASQSCGGLPTFPYGLDRVCTSRCSAAPAGAARQPSVTFAALRAGLPEIDESIFETKSRPHTKQRAKRARALALAQAASVAASTQPDERGGRAVKRIRALLAGSAEAGSTPAAAAGAATPLPLPGTANWGLNALGWWLVERRGSALPVVPASSSSSSSSRLPAAAAAAPVSYGPTALPGQPYPGWGDLRCRAALDLSAPPFGCLGLQPPPIPPYATISPSLHGAMAVCVRTASSVVRCPTTRLSPRTVAARASRARTELLRSSDFATETTLKHYLQAADSHAISSAAAAGAGAAAAAAAEGEVAHTGSALGSVQQHTSYHTARLPRRQSLAALVRAGRVPQLECLRIGAQEAQQLGLAPEWPYYSSAEEQQQVMQVLEGGGGSSSSSSSSVLVGAEREGGQAVPEGLAGAAALAVTDPLTLCKKLSGAFVTQLSGARRKWELGVEGGVRKLPTLSASEAPDAAFLIPGTGGGGRRQ